MLAHQKEGWEQDQNEDCAQHKKYAVFFPSDKTSEEFALDEDGLD